MRGTEAEGLDGELRGATKEMRNTKHALYLGECSASGVAIDLVDREELARGPSLRLAEKANPR